jgi:putative membrane protein
MKILIKVLLVALAIMGLPRFIHGVHVESFYFAFFASIVLGLVNLVIRPFVKLVTLPVNIITLGLFGLVINGLLLWLVARYIPGFSIDDFSSAFLSALVISGVSFLASELK